MKQFDEVWLPINGYDGRYFISDNGRVKNSAGLIMKQCKVKRGRRNGYLNVMLSGRKRFYIHRLVATHFILNPNELPWVNHKDGNGLNNHKNNLEWSTPSENVKHSYKILGQKPTGLPVLNLETGIFYESSTEAYNTDLIKVTASHFNAILAGTTKNKTSFIRI